MLPKPKYRERLAPRNGATQINSFPKRMIFREFLDSIRLQFVSTCKGICHQNSPSFNLFFQGCVSEQTT